ncbi:MAG: aconitase X catalytic domain-containing protein [Nitrososphaerota archaeon]|nr:aconitase X catalytic domain-containing protein [Nitrososphaerota archaeon]MDG6929854.1 aconitase X catalytic domain-containing protein [Nitrososphaerota archaeon]
MDKEMILEKDEEKGLNGEYGEGIQSAYRILVAVGKAMGAERMIRITSAHISGVNYHNIGDAGLDFLEDMSRTSRFSVKTTINPCGAPLEGDYGIEFPKDLVDSQLRIVNAFRKMGAQGSCNCVPFEGENAPQRGEHVSWAESNAVVYGNSIAGIMTNRESGLSALAAAVVGKTPYYGLHIEENRKPKEFVNVTIKLDGGPQFAALGYFLGRRFRDVVGISGISGATHTELKALAASVGTYGPMGMFGVVQNGTGVEFGKAELEESLAKISDSADGEAIVLGCPFLSADEVSQFARSLKGRTMVKKTYLFTYRSSFDELKASGYYDDLKRAGVEILPDVCPTLSRIPELLGVRSIITDSGKASFYMKASSKVGIKMMKREDIISAYSK